MGQKNKKTHLWENTMPYISHTIYICLHIMWSFVLGKQSCFCNSVEEEIPIWTSNIDKLLNTIPFKVEC